MRLPFQFARFRPRLMSSMAGYNREHIFRRCRLGPYGRGSVALRLAMTFAIAAGLKLDAGIGMALAYFLQWPVETIGSRFGGMPATGTIARTVTNVRAGATSPVSGLVHCLTLVMVVLVAAPMAVHVPLAVLAGILLSVAWNRGEWRELVDLKRASNHYRLLMLGTFFLTVVFDLPVALQLGLLLACVLFVRRMSSLFQVVEVSRSCGEASFRLHGSLFFGAVAKIDPILKLVESAPQGLMVRLDLEALQSLDA